MVCELVFSFSERILFHGRYVNALRFPSQYYWLGIVSLVVYFRVLRRALWEEILIEKKKKKKKSAALHSAGKLCEVWRMTEIRNI